MEKSDYFNHPDIQKGTRELKIGINATFLNEKPTGIGVFTREVSIRLCALNKNTHVFTSVSLGTLKESCIKKTPVFIRGSLKLTNNLNRFLYINTILPYIVKKSRINVLFCPIMEYPFIPSSPLIVTVHDLHPVYFPKQFGLSSDYFKFSLKLLPRLAHRVVVPSNFVKKELLKVLDINSESIDVIPMGYNATVFNPQGDEMRRDFFKSYGIKEPFILFVGSLFPYKNIKILLKAFMDIKDRIPHSLIIIGKKELSPEPLQGSERVRYLEYVSNHELPKFYSYADLLVHPSLTEGFGMTILEAMACGAPIISSKGGSLPEVVGEAGILFDPEDRNKLSELILTVINNEGLRKDMIEKGFSNVKRFSWDSTAEGILESCERALKEAG